MRHLVYLFLLSAVAMLLGLTACIDDSYTTSSSDVLTFSTDSLSFDTVVTEEGTVTKAFVIYNRAKKQVSISSIRVAGNPNGRFFINVDGEKGEEFHDVDIRGGDSIFVFVECVVNSVNSNDPVEMKDRIEFVTNGVQQTVKLVAWGLDVERIYGDTLTDDLHLTAVRPYVIYDTLTVASGATLTVDAGAKLLFHDKALLRVYGRMEAIGTADEPIVLRGDRMDNVVSDISFDILPGQWCGVVFGEGSYDNEWAYVTMKSSDIGMHCSSTDPDQLTLHMLNCVLRNTSSSVLTSLNARIEAEGTEFSDCAGGVVHFIGGTVHLVNCTLANYFLFVAPTEPIVNVWTDHVSETVLPLEVYLDNCIIYGLSSDINVGVLDNYEVYLRNCLLRSAGSDDSRFINCVWAGDPMFYTIREDYVFDYRLHDGSDAIGRGDRSLCPDYARYDRYGNDRFGRPELDLGAYVWMPEEE